MSTSEWIKLYSKDDGIVAVALDCGRCYIDVDDVEAFIAGDYGSTECLGWCRHPSNVTYVDFNARIQ